MEVDLDGLVSFVSYLADMYTKIGGDYALDLLPLGNQLSYLLDPHHIALDSVR